VSAATITAITALVVAVGNIVALLVHVKGPKP
jgi:hypothetical protein